jgi:glycosyltransferase involved in cell wall biosynthesis
MKVLNLQIALSGGGAEKVTELLAPHLQEQLDFFIRVGCIGNGANGEDTFVLTQKDSLFAKIFLAPFRLSKLLRALKPDVLHVHCERPEFTLALASFLPNFPKKDQMAKVFITEHTGKPWLNSNLLGSIVRRRLATLNAQWFTCIEGDTSKIFIPNPVQILPRLNEPNGVPRVFALGRLAKGKRIDLLINYFQQIEGETEFLIVGDGPERGYLESLAISTPQVKFLGSALRPWDFIREGDIYVSASEYEGSPLALLEALSLDVQVLVSDIPAHRALLNPNSLFASSDEFCSKLKVLLTKRDVMSPEGDNVLSERLIEARRPREIAELWLREYRK